jgi:pimeloyl-ACP methyl ester carboxylesterase
VTERHVRAIARARAFARLTDSVPTYLLTLVLVTLGSVGLAVALYVGTPLEAGSRLVQGRTADVLARWGSTLMILAAVAFLVVALLASSVETFRRQVGVVWDLAGFWPRAVHPLAAPSYGEKAVPDLVGRLRDQTGDRCVVLSAHSQGSVLGIATILQLPPDTAAKVCLLSYGSPLTRLYCAFFPGYYNADAFEGAMERLGVPVDDRARWPWVNLYRTTDPIGGWVLRAQGAAAVLPPQEVDVLLRDPAPHVAGDEGWPTIRGHSGYFPGDDYTRALAAVVQRRSAASVPGRQPAADRDGAG